jgi:PEP-CTERM motif
MLKPRLATLCLVAMCLAALPVAAQTLYTNGPINGTTDSWAINFGFAVSDTFTLTSNSTVTGLMFGTFSFEGDVLENAEVEITSSEFGGTVYTDQVVDFTASGCHANQYGFNVCTQSGSFPTSVNLAAGTYWLNLDNAVVNDGDPIYWDENSGPSQASENSVGTIPSESFTVLGSSSGSGSVPEPGSILLLGSGILAIAGLARRNLF